MGALYKDGDILIHPYRGEGFGMHVQEAMAAGCVPMVTAGGATDDFVNDQNALRINSAVIKIASLTGCKIVPLAYSV